MSDYVRMEKVRSRRWSKFKRNKAALVGLFILSFLIIVAVFAPFLAPYDPNKISLANTFEGPSWSHPFGRDQLGRDIFSRVIHGARISLAIALITTGIATLIGTSLGLVSGYYGGVIDDVIMRLTEIVMVFPSFLLALVIVGIFGPGTYNAIIAVSIAFTPRFIRQARGAAIAVRGKDFIEAAKALGTSDLAIMIRHILPNCLAPIIVQATLLVGYAVLITASLGFLGLGVQPPTPEWGAMLSDGRSYLATAPHIATFPGLAIFLTVIAFNLVGDGLRDAFDIRREPGHW